MNDRQHSGIIFRNSASTVKNALMNQPPKGTTMKKFTVLLVAAVWLALPIPVKSNPLQEQILKRKDVPASILHSFDQSYPAATIKGYSKEVEKGKTFYEIESVEGSLHRDILYAADGTVVSIEESLPYADFPKPVRDAIGKEYPQAKIQISERVTKGQTIEYEVVLRVGKTKVEVVCEPGGKILKKEKL